MRALGAHFDRLAARVQRLVDGPYFQAVVVAAILANAVLLGLETYDALTDVYGDVFRVMNGVFLGFFVVEILLRMLSYGRRPQDYFKSGWNVFDFCVIGASFVPGIASNATALRLVRLLRVVRLVSVVPDIRVLIAGLGRSLAPIGTLMLLVVFIMYVYAMLGWLLFADIDPARWGDVGEAMLTLFGILTLEGWIEVADVAEQRGPLAWLYFISFILIGVFVVLNMVIGVLITSLESARDEARAAREEERRRAADRGGEGMAERIRALRVALDDLERDLEQRGGAPPGAPSPDSPG